MYRNHSAKFAERFRLAPLVLATAAFFLILHPYLGLVHDARLYTLQALSHLHPALYKNDIFLRFGSQDDYTLFSPIYAWVVNWIDVEPAAAAITFVGMVLFMVASWALARSLLPAPQAWTALLLLVMVPAYYGPARIFHYLEEFVTPRQLAEGLVLLALAVWFRDKRIASAVLAGSAMLVHPIIGLSGVALLSTLRWVLPHWRKCWPVAVAAALIGILAIFDWIPVSRWQFDAGWHQLVMRRSYLGLLHWDSDDWGRVATVIITLAMAAGTSRSRLRSLAYATLITTIVLLLVAFAGGDLLRIVLIVQAQVWRVLWLATVIAIILVPSLYADNWSTSSLKRCALVLLAACWIAPHATPALITAPLAFAAFTYSRPLQQGHARLFLAGAWIALVMIIVYGLADALLTWKEGLTQRPSLPYVLDRNLILCRNGIVPGLLVLAGACAARGKVRRSTTAMLALPIVIVITFAAAPLASTWTTIRYNPEQRDAYSSWRKLIPPGSDVMWAREESMWGDGATNTWLLLERPSYLSGTQSPNALFSRQAAFEMQARAKALWGLLPFTDRLRPAGDQHSRPSRPLLLAPICRASTVRYVVTEAAMADATPIPAPINAPPSLRDYKLYICT